MKKQSDAKKRNLTPGEYGGSMKMTMEQKAQNNWEHVAYCLGRKIASDVGRMDEKEFRFVYSMSRRSIATAQDYFGGCISRGWIRAEALTVTAEAMALPSEIVNGIVYNRG